MRDAEKQGTSRKEKSSDGGSVSELYRDVLGQALVGGRQAGKAARRQRGFCHFCGKESAPSGLPAGCSGYGEQPPIFDIFP